MRVNLYYLSPNPYGGWVTYTAHLYLALKAAGLSVSLYRIRQRSEVKSRDFGYGIRYRNITLADALRNKGASLIVAAAKKFQVETTALVEAGSCLVLHDPTELKNLPPIEAERTFVIRRSSLGIVPGATFIRHPYMRQLYPTMAVDKRIHAVSTARIDFDKHTELILAANRQLPEDRKVQLHGFENRLYGKFKLMPAFPEWKAVQSTHTFKRTLQAAIDILKPAFYSVDLSEIKGDGGGTQYTFLEAWDAFAVPVIYAAWVRDFPNDDMQHGENCVVVHDVDELVEWLNGDRMGAWHRLVQGGQAQLALHEPRLIGNAYAKVLAKFWP